MSDFQLLYYSKKGKFFAYKELKLRYIKLVHKICWQHFLKYQFAFLDSQSIINFGEFIFFQATNIYQQSRKVPFKPFFCLVLKYSLMDQIARIQNNKCKSLGVAIFYQQFNNAHNFLKSPKESVEKVALGKIFYEKCLKVLSPNQQDIIIKWAEGYSYNEIAQKSMLNVKGVDNQIQKIIGTLKKAFAY